MPVLSYIAIPRAGAKDELLAVLKATQYCEAIPADNEDIVVLVTDTPDKQTDKKLYGQLKNLQSLESLSMTFGYNDEKPLGGGEVYEGQ